MLCVGVWVWVHVHHVAASNVAHMHGVGCRWPAISISMHACCSLERHGSMHAGTGMCTPCNALRWQNLYPHICGTWVLIGGYSSRHTLRERVVQTCTGPRKSCRHHATIASHAVMQHAVGQRLKPS